MLPVLVWAGRSRSSSLREGLGNAAVSGVVIVALCLLGEAVFRTPSLSQRLGLRQEQLSWQLERYDHLWDANIFGFRSPYERLRRSEDAHRVVTLGDSFTWGEKIADARDTWPGRLEDLLDAEGPFEYQVVNMAGRGYTTANEVEILNRLGWQFDPDLVILQLFQNDALPSGPGLQRQGLLFSEDHILPTRFRTARVAESAFLSALELGYRSLRHGPEATLKAHVELYAEGQVGWEQMKAALVEVADSAEVRGTPVLVVLFPFFYPGRWTPDTYPLGEVNEKITHAVEAAGLPLLDLTREFASSGRDGREWWAAPYDAHPNRGAHDLAARAIHRRLVAMGWTGSDAPGKR